MKVKPDETYLLYHPSYSHSEKDNQDFLYDIVQGDFDANGELIGWKSQVNGNCQPLAIKGFSAEWQDRIIPIKNLLTWQKPV